MKTFAILLLFTMSAMAADLSGQWVGTFAVTGSNETIPQQFTLKQNGKTLTGSGGPNNGEQYPIKNGKIDGDSVSFELTSYNSDVGFWQFKYELKRTGQQMSGDLQLKNGNEVRTAKVSLKEVE